MNDEARRVLAQATILDFATSIDTDHVYDQEHYFGSIKDAEAIADLIRTATVTITWPDPCPACGALGCTEHPTWAAESKPAPVPFIHDCAWRDTNVELRRQLAEHKAGLVAVTTELVAEPAGLTPAQEIRLRVTEAMLGSDGYVGVPNLAADVTAVVLPLARMVETGEPSPEPEPEPYRPSALIPRPAGYSQTLHLPADVVERAAAIKPYPGEVVTAQDPGGLLSEPEMGTASAADLDMIAKATGGGLRSSEITPEYDEEGASAQEPPEPSDPHSGTPEGSTGLHGPGATAQSPSERSDEGAGAS